MVAGMVQRLPDFRMADERAQLDAVVAAWLHNVIEDTEETTETLQAAGVSERAVGAVTALTRTDDIPPDDYYATIAQHPVARLVKIADIANNLTPERTALEPATRERVAAKYAHALHQLNVNRFAINDLHAPPPDHA